MPLLVLLLRRKGRDLAGFEATQICFDYRLRKSFQQERQSLTPLAISPRRHDTFEPTPAKNLTHAIIQDATSDFLDPTN